ncbi:MAG: hypothetical protein J6C75_03985 [Oscillospiraceae bacterium]|nr:hypothetical protein [Oscillospiraceae bacterium]
MRKSFFAEPKRSDDAEHRKTGGENSVKAVQVSAPVTHNTTKSRYDHTLSRLMRMMFPK